MRTKTAVRDNRPAEENTIQPKSGWQPVSIFAEQAAQPMCSGRRFSPVTVV